MPTSTLDHLTQRLLDWYQAQSWAVELEALTPLVLTELADAFTLTRRLSARWFQAAPQDEDGPSLEAA